MKIRYRVRSLFNIKYVKEFIRTFLATAGGIFLLLESLIIFRIVNKPLSGSEFAITFCLCIFLSFVITYPKLKISRRLSSPDTCITVKVGNLFNEPGHLVIGMSDTFDTEIGDIIKKDSIQGQFLAQIYENNRNKLDDDLAQALLELNKEFDGEKRRGKPDRYPIGSVAALNKGSKKYFCIAYSKMGKDLKAQSSPELILDSLNKLWDAIRLGGQGTLVSIPVIGSDLARVGLPYSVLIQLIITSFVLSSKKEFITKEINIIVYEKDIEKVSLVDMESFLQLICH